MFDFLRLIFRDRRLEESEAACAVAQAKLDENESRLNALESRVQEKTDTGVETDYIALLWTFVVLVAGIALKAAAEKLVPILERLLDIPSAPPFNAETDLFPLIGWGLIFVYGFAFSIDGGLFVYRLLLEYAERRKNLNYKRFAKGLLGFFFVYIVGITITVIGPVVNYLLVNIVFYILGVDASIDPTTGF